MAEDKVELQIHISKVLLDIPFATLSTVGEGQVPFTRWMSPIFLGGDWKAVYALVAPRSRKVAQVRANPSVTWVFNTPTFDEVITLRGTAEIVDDAMLRAEIWEALPDKTRSFILMNDENLAFSILRTKVRSVEYVRPRVGQTKPIVVEL
jgi:general stress protein 26